MDGYYFDFLSDMHAITIPISSAANPSSAVSLMATAINDVIELLRQDMIIAKEDADHPPVLWSAFTAASLGETNARISTHINPRRIHLGCS